MHMIRSITQNGEANMKIRSMQSRDLDFAAQCTETEGWTGETRLEFEGFYAHDPAGCFIAEHDSQKIAIGVATYYGEYAFVGELIVAKEWRGRGIGRQMLEHAIAYLRQCSAKNILLDGVVRAVTLYERAGFRKICRSLRFSGHLPGRQHPHVRAMRAEDLPAVCALDRQVFVADRSFFLKRRLAVFSELCKVYEQGGKIAGFIFGRRSDGPQGPAISAGPWVVTAGVEHPQYLLESLAFELPGCLLRLGVLESNTNAATLLRGTGFAEHPEPPWRMLLGNEAGLGLSTECYAIGSPAKG